MPWKPDIAPGELVLVECHATARRGVQVHVVLTERQLVWSRPSVWSLDGLTTERDPVAEISQVALRSRPAWGMWTLGTLLVVFLIGVGLSGHLSEDWHASLLLVAGIVAVFSVARPRLRLGWSCRGRRRSILSPWIDHQKRYDQIKETLIALHDLLGDRHRFTLAVQARERAVIEEEAERETADAEPGL
jgi:hypothetical protein